LAGNTTKPPETFAGKAGGEMFPSEQLMLGVIGRDYDLLTIAEQALGLTSGHFRHKGHSQIFKAIASMRDKKTGVGINAERARNSGYEAWRYVAELIDAAALRHTPAERAPALATDTARAIIGSLRSSKDRNNWLEQVLASCARQDIGTSEFLTAFGISRHVNYDTGHCFPGYETLAKNTGQSVRTVEGSIPALTGAQHLHVGKFGRGRALTPLLRTKLDAAKRKAAEVGQGRGKRSDMDDEIPF
jgi:hypothetical protein